MDITEIKKITQEYYTKDMNNATGVTESLRERACI